MDIPNITFGIIVLNGEPFTRYCLRAIYPYAHQIIVVEGAAPGAAKIATADGHSTDGTLEVLHRFKIEEDPDNKLQIITRDGFWSEKDEQSEAYAKAATGDYLWQIDIDEFYKEEDMDLIIDMLKNDPDLTMMSFPSITFWGGFDYVADSWYLKNGGQVCHRLFQWKPGYKYVTHRPATVANLEGQDLRSLKWLGPKELQEKKIVVFHYSLVFPKQVREKALYYSNAPWLGLAQGIVQWAETNFLNPVSRPYQVHNVHMQPSWIEKFHGSHPGQIQNLQNHIRSGEIKIECRNNSDIEMFESRILYRFGRWLLKTFSFFYRQNHFIRWKLSGLAFRVKFDVQRNRLYLKKDQ